MLTKRLGLGLGLGVASATLLALLPSTARAGVIADENKQTAGVTGDFLAGNDGSAATKDGVVDVYPDQWSVVAGTAVHLRIRSSGSGYGVQVFRVGWYGGKGAREFTPAAGISGPADEQPYPTPDGKYGLAASGWHDSATIDTTGFVPGLYVARVTQSNAASLQAETFFVVRDDALAAKQPLLFVLSFNTHEAYNAWPGSDRGGKSLYAFNSSATPVSSTNAAVRRGQAVKVSFQRPFLVGGGTADVFRWEYPMIRWLEKNGWEVAYALDRDIDTTPAVIAGRAAAIFAGHAEYWSGQAFTNLLAARDAGVSQLWVSGDTLSWQVRYENGVDTMVGYKENWPNDPMNKTDPDQVTRGFKTLPHPRPGIQLTGVLSSGQIKTAAGTGADYPYADLIVANPIHWIYAGTTLTSGSKIANVMGYEVDSCAFNTPEVDPYRPPGQILLGVITQPWDGLKKGSPCYYQKAIGGGKNVEVIGIGSMAFTWALDDYAQKSGYAAGPESVDKNAQQMITNVLTRWSGGPPPTFVPDGGLEDVGSGPPPVDPEDAGGDAANPAGDDGGMPGDPDAAPGNGATPAPADGRCSCRLVGGDGTPTRDAGLALAFGAVVLGVARRRRRALPG